ncbi:MAG TPA: hypothetical protein VGK67_31925 [Myxococcales bacterium]
MSSDLWLAIHVEGEGPAVELKVDQLQERIDASGVGDAVGRMSGLGDITVIVEMPETCTEADLPNRMQALREILAGEGLEGRVEIPEDAGDDWDDDEDDEDGADEEGGS